MNQEMAFELATMWWEACPTCHGYGPMSSMELVGIPGADPMYGCSTCTSVKDEPGMATGIVYPMRVQCRRCEGKGYHRRGDMWKTGTSCVPCALCGGKEIPSDHIGYRSPSKVPKTFKGRGWMPSLSMARIMGALPDETCVDVTKFGKTAWIRAKQGVVYRAKLETYVNGGIIDVKGDADTPDDAVCLAAIEWQKEKGGRHEV